MNLLSSRWLKRSVIAGALLVALLVALLLLYFAIHPDYRLGSGLYHLLQPNPPAVEVNPTIADVSRARVSWLADISDYRLHESSGLTASNVHNNVLWSLNDSGNGATLFALGLDGSTQGVLRVDTPYSYDWESLDSFVDEGVSYLIIGDTGDNFRWRERSTLLVVAEPEALFVNHPADGDLDSISATPVAWHIHYSYPDGPRDVEAMAVDAARNRILLLSKRVHPPELFALPLAPADDAVAEKLAELVGLPEPTRVEMEREDDAGYTHMPSGMDVSGGAGGRLLITTYRHGYLYDLDLASGTPVNLRRVPLPSIGQREALTFAANSNRLAYVSKERKDGVGVADLFMIELLDVSAKKPPEVVAAEPGS